MTTFDLRNMSELNLAGKDLSKLELKQGTTRSTI